MDLFTGTFAGFGISVTFVEPEGLTGWAGAMTEKTRAFLLESVSHPLASLVDLRTGPSSSARTWCCTPPPGR